MKYTVDNRLDYNIPKQDYYSPVQLKLPVDVSYSIDEDDPVRTFMGSMKIHGVNEEN